MERSTEELLQVPEKGNKEDISMNIFNKNPVRTKSLTRQSVMPKNSFNSLSFESVLRRSISESVEKNICRRVTLHAACRDGLTDTLSTLLLKTSVRLNSYDSEGLAPLHYAARYDRTHVIQMLLAAGADPNVVTSGDVKHLTPLHYAARFNSTASVRMLIQNGADPSRRSVFGQHALHYAVRRCNEDLIKILVIEGRADPNVVDNENCTPLHVASQFGRLKIVQLLLLYGADPSIPDSDGYTAVHLAAKEGHADVLKILLHTVDQKGASCTAILNTCHNDTNNTCLHLAVKYGNLQACKVCIDYGADTTALQSDLSTPLHAASCSGDVEMVKLLVENAADIDAEDADGMTPILRASLGGHVKVIEYLLDQRAELNPAPGSCAPSPLTCAVKRGHHQAIRFLLERGADMCMRDFSQRTCMHVAVYSADLETVNILLEHSQCLLESRDKDDKTPMHYAAAKGNLQIIQLLLVAGASVNAKDEEERLPLHFAAEAGHLPCVELLLELKPESLESVDYRMRTPLHYSCSKGSVKVSKYLVDKGADVDCRDDDHVTPLHQAARVGCTSTTEFLLNNGAKIDATNKNRFTPLGTAALFGEVKIVKLLLDRGANMECVSAFGNNCLETAINAKHPQVCIEIIRHNRWSEAFKTKGEDGFCLVKKLIEKFPLAAKLVLDKCIEASNHFETDERYTITYNLQYLNPHPDEMMNSEGERYFAPKTMLDCGREELIFHPLTEELMYHKWRTIGLPFFYIGAVFYVVFLASLTLTVQCLHHRHSYGGESSTSHSFFHVVCSEGNKEIVDIVLAVMVGVNLMFEFYQMYTERLDYLDMSNVVELCTFIPTLLGLCFGGFDSADVVENEFEWTCFICGVLCGYISLLLYLQLLFQSGIYVTMLFEVMKTLLKVMAMFVVLLFAFALIFQLLLSTDKNNEDQTFNGLDMSMLKVIDMMLGELEYTRFFVDQTPPMAVLSRLAFLAFCIMIPIVLMNLLIGLAVGDIETVQKNAELKRMAIQIDAIFEFEKKLPFAMLRRMYCTNTQKQPNRHPCTFRERVFKLGHKLVRSTVPDLPNKDHDLQTQRVEFVLNKLAKQEERINDIIADVKSQRLLLERIANMVSSNKMDTTGDSAPSNVL